VAFDSGPTAWRLHLAAGVTLCIAAGCQSALDPGCQSGESCPTDVRNMQKWTIGEDAVFCPPCGPDYGFHGYRATSWRDWPTSGPEWRDQTSLYPSVSISEYSDWHPGRYKVPGGYEMPDGFEVPDAYEVLDPPAQAVEEPTADDFPDQFDDFPDQFEDRPDQFEDRFENEPRDVLPPPEVPSDFPPPTPLEMEPLNEDDQSTLEFREPSPEDEPLGDPPLPALSN
jgi:hypothetical protein